MANKKRKRGSNQGKKKMDTNKSVEDNVVETYIPTEPIEEPAIEVVPEEPVVEEPAVEMEEPAPDVIEVEEVVVDTVAEEEAAKKAEEEEELVEIEAAAKKAEAVAKKAKKAKDKKDAIVAAAAKIEKAKKAKVVVPSGIDLLSKLLDARKIVLQKPISKANRPFLDDNMAKIILVVHENGSFEVMEMYSEYLAQYASQVTDFIGNLAKNGTNRIQLKSISAMQTIMELIARRNRLKKSFEINDSLLDSIVNPKVVKYLNSVI